MLATMRHTSFVSPVASSTSNLVSLYMFSTISSHSCSCTVTFTFFSAVMARSTAATNACASATDVTAGLASAVRLP